MKKKIQEYIAQAIKLFKIASFQTPIFPIHLRFYEID